MNEDDRRIFARNLNTYMDRDGINGVALAKYMKVSSATVSDWTHAKKMPRIDKIKSLANYFRIDVTDLTDDKLGVKEVPEILKLYEQLSDDGQRELIKRAKELIILEGLK